MGLTQTSEAGVKISNAGTNGQFLQKQSGNTGGLTWATVSTDVVSDTSPQLGGNLDVNTKNIVFGDSGGSSDDRLTFGAGTDLSIYHNGSHSYIWNSTGDLQIRSNSLNMFSVSGEQYFQGTSNGATELYYDNVKKFETTSAGVQVNGDFKILNGGDDIFFDASENWMRWDDNVKIQCGNSGDLNIYHDGTTSYVQNATGELHIRSNTLKLTDYNSSHVYLRGLSGNTTELYYDNAKKFETDSGGVKFFGNIYGGDNNEIRLGDNGDLQFFHHSGTGEGRIYNSNSGGLVLVSNTIKLRNQNNNELLIQAEADGAVKLYYDNVKKFETTAAGANLLGNLTLFDSNKLELGDGADLQLFHDGTWSYVRATNGNLAIQGKTGENSVVCIPDGKTSLYYDNSEKLETTSTGVQVTGNIDIDGNIDAADGSKLKLGTGDDFQIYHDGTHSWLTNDTGTLVVEADTLDIRAVNNEHYIEAVKDGSVKLYFDNSTKLETSNTGVTVTGAVTPSSGVYIGGSGGSNHLDDYEEGSFDPVVRPSSNTFSITMQGDTGAYYTKVGRQVFVSGCVRWTAYSVGNASGNLLISLPFTAASRDNGDNSDDNWGFRVPVWGGSNRPNMGLTVPGQANMIMMHGTQGTDSVSPSDAGSTGMVQFSGHFRI